MPEDEADMDEIEAMLAIDSALPAQPFRKAMDPRARARRQYCIVDVVGCGGGGFLSVGFDSENYWLNKENPVLDAHQTISESLTSLTPETDKSSASGGIPMLAAVGGVANGSCRVLNDKRRQFTLEIALCVDIHEC